MIDPHYSSVVLLVPFEGNSNRYQDYSPNKKTLVAYGGVIPSSNSKYYANCAYFNGSSGYIDILPSMDFAFGDGDFTVEFWIKVVRHTTDDISSGWPCIINPSLTLNDPGGFQIWIRRNAEPRWAIEFAPRGEVVVSTNTPSTDGQWHHVAVCRGSGVAYCFYDGTLTSSTPDTVTYTRAGPEGFRLARRSGAVVANTMAAMFMQDLRITKGVCRYTEDFVPPGRFLSDTNLSGTVISDDGVPRSGSIVRCINRDPKIQQMWTTRTDRNGNYSFLLPKGEYTIIAQSSRDGINDLVKRVRN